MNDARTVLVTGGAGYIGSHTCVVLLEAGARVVVIDNLDNSGAVALDRVRELGSVIHLARRKAAVSRSPSPSATTSTTSPAPCSSYRRWNGTPCTTWCSRRRARCTENHRRCPSPKARRSEPPAPTAAPKLHIEEMLRDVAATNDWRMVLLRHFNPVGAHPSGRIGEDPVRIPNNLMPYIMQVAVGRRDHLTVFGDDYPTADGTAVRDYLHVVDLAERHLAALDRIDRIEGAQAVKLGTGLGSSVLDVVHAAAAATGRDIPYEIGTRRAGDVVAAWADASLADTLLDWRASRTLAGMCTDHWRWQAANPRRLPVDLKALSAFARQRNYRSTQDAR